MSYSIIVSSRFEKELKKLIKKNPSFKSEFSELISSLKQNPFQGSPLGNDCYKIRLSIASKGKGKSGGARVITHVYVFRSTVYLLSVYDKSDKDNIAENELLSLLKDIEK